MDISGSNCVVEAIVVLEIAFEVGLIELVSQVFAKDALCVCAASRFNFLDNLCSKVGHSS